MTADRPPVDLRLLPAAAATWVSALVGVSAPPAVSVAWAGVLAAAGVLSAAVLVPRRWLPWPSPPVVLAVVACAVAADLSGAWRLHSLHDGPVAVWASDRAVVSVEAVVSADPVAVRAQVRGNARAPAETVVRVTVRRVEARGHVVTTRLPVVVVAPSRGWSTLVPGQDVRVAGRLRPADRTDDTAAVLTARGPPTLGGAPGPVQQMAAAVREHLRRAAGGLDPATGGLLTGLVDGDTSLLPDDTKDEFRVSGLTHLTAVSGANVAFVLAAVLAMARWVGLRGYAVRVAGLTALAGFVVVARPEPSVVRAAVMAVLALLAAWRGGRGRAGPGVLAAAVLLLVLTDPFLARSPGFALSVLATAGLLVLAPGWQDRWARRLPRWLAEALAVTVAAQVASWPVLVLLTPQVSLVSVPANLLAAPAVPVATVLGVAAAAVAMVLPAAGVVAAHVAAGLPIAAVPWVPGVAGAVTLVLAMLLARVAGPPLLRRPPLLLGLAAVAVLALPGSPVRPSSWPPPAWLLVACDVGQGDALVLDTGPGRAVVVDSGPDPRAVDRCLRDLGVRQVPLVVLTHFHADHVEGLPGVLRGRAVGEIEVSPLAEPADEADRVQAWARTAGVPVTVAKVGERRDDGPVAWQVLWPRRLIREGSPPNNASVVLRVETAGLVILLTGDVEPEAQDALLAEPLSLRADVVKVAHHGSANQDPAFVRAVAAPVALISVGVGNPYGHPAPSTVDMLRRAGVVLGRTDQEGDLAVVAVGGRPALVPRRPP